MKNAAVTTLLILAVIYMYGADFIQPRFSNPLFMMIILMGSVFVFGLNFLVGHYLEKVFNLLSMWGQGFNPRTGKRQLLFPFITFDLLTQLQKFHKNEENKMDTFIGLNAERK